VVETSRGQVECAEDGVGEPVLYFHGAGATCDVMLDIEDPLVADGFRLIVPNRPGYGRTPLARNDSAAACADLAAALLDALGLARVGVMGSSGGAAFATSFAVRHADRTSALVLLCPQLHRWDHKRWLPRHSRWTLPILSSALTRAPLLALYRLQLRRMTAAQLLQLEAGDRYVDVAGDAAAQALAGTTLEAMRRATAMAGFANDFVVFMNEDILGGASLLSAPTLVIHDAMDPLAPVEHVAWFQSQCAACETLPIHAAGHLVWVGPQADAMHQARVRFLRSHRP
jgi:pimeloyl-ACP methyl ester carboxylesterase